MISAKRVEELRKMNTGHIYFPNGITTNDIFVTLSAALKVVEAAKEALKHEYIKVDNFNKLDSLKEALAPFTSEPSRSGKGQEEKE